jgi:RNA polymerase sigma-70 factor (ECF subfamily)
MTTFDPSDAQKLDEPDETVIRRAFDAGLMDLAATSAINTYRDQIVSFIRTRVRDSGDACEVYSMFMEDLWRGLPAFNWRCSMRTWSYCLARNATTRYLSAPTRRRAQQAVPQPEALENIAAAVPTTAQPYMRDTVQDRFRAIREALSDSDQTILILRIDRTMSFRDIAITLHGDTDLGEDALAREAARLRKAFERIKVELRRLAERAGLLPPRRAGGRARSRRDDRRGKTPRIPDHGSTSQP